MKPIKAAASVDNGATANTKEGRKAATDVGLTSPSHPLNTQIRHRHPDKPETVDVVETRLPGKDE
jgi:hypothetical protein